jgi:hypothetical protein
MKKFYTLSLFACCFLFIGCSKDALKSYDKRILGSWRIIDLDKRGLGSSMSLPFTEGIFTFEENGRFTWDVSGRIYQGSWDLRREHNGDNGNRSLHLTAVDFSSQDVRSEYFNELQFTNTNRIRAVISDGSRSYVYRFLRQ